MGDISFGAELGVVFFLKLFPDSVLIKLKHEGKGLF